MLAERCSAHHRKKEEGKDNSVIKDKIQKRKLVCNGTENFSDNSLP